MRLSDLFTRTLRDFPAEAELVSHQLAIRAGLVRPVAAGIYALMPLGWRALRNMERILREELDAIGGQEVRLPVVHPADIWQATGRWESFGPVLQRFSTESGREFALGPTAEEVIALLAAREIDSHKQLPQHLYQIHTKYRHEPRARGGLVRLREFTMKDAYSLDADLESLDRFFERMIAAYRRIFARVGVDVLAIDADSGSMGGRASQEFVMLHDQGEDSFAQCASCGYAANVEVAEFSLAQPEPVARAAVEQVATPDCKTIEDVARFLDVPTSQTLKAVFFMHEQPGQEERFVFVVVRGDLAINEAKLIGVLGGGTLRAATEDEIRAVGAEPGYASPVGLAEGVMVAADRSIRAGANFVAGANVEGHHLTGVNIPRDFSPTLEGDIAEAFEGAVCARCGQGHLQIRSAIELGHCFKLGTFYSEKAGITYQDQHGEERPVVMGSYGIGLERLLAAIIECHHDDWGIIWPVEVAPFQVHVLSIGKDPAYIEQAQALYRDLQAAGYTMLLDDRAESAGVKFADADLIGAPVRFAVSRKALENGGVEAKLRHSRDREIVPLDGVREWVDRQFGSGS